MENMETPTNLSQMYALGILAFILFLSTLVGMPVLPQLSQELGAGVTEIPIVVSAALVTVVIVQFFSGVLADHYSKRTLILTGALIGSLSSLLCVVATHWTQLVVLRVLGGIADALAMPALLAITASLGTEQPGKFFGILRGSQGLSFVIAPALGSVFSLVSLRMPFLVDGILSLVAFLATCVLLKDHEKVKAEHDLRVFRGLKSTFADRRVYLYLLMGIAGLFGYGIFLSFVPTKSQILGLDAWHIGVILSSGALIFSLVSYGIGVLSDRLGRKKFVIAAQLCITIAGIGLLWSGSFAGLLLFYGVFCLGETITFLLSFVYATEIFDKQYLGTAMGVFDSLMDLSLFVGPLMAISLYKATGQMMPIFLMAIIPAIATFFAATAWLPRNAKSRL